MVKSGEKGQRTIEDRWVTEKVNRFIKKEIKGDNADMKGMKKNGHISDRRKMDKEDKI